MRLLALMRGAPGCGKSTWLRENGLEDYALSADKLRLMTQSPVMDDELGQLQVSQKNDRQVWELLFQLLEQRMERGELCVVDACHSKSQDFAKYKKLIEKHRYRMCCVDFSGVPLETCLRQNAMRPEWKRVPEHVIENICARLKTQPAPAYCKVVKPGDTEAVKSLFFDWKPKDAESYSEVVMFGDIHGCFQPLQKWFDENPFNDRALYVFCGDYVDRGIQNAEVVSWLLSVYEKPNVILLEGNHEKWLREYAAGEYDAELLAGVRDRCRSAEFFERTAPQLAKLDKKDLRQLCRKLQALAYFTFAGKRWLVTHAGVGFLPERIPAIAASQFIKGGRYADDCDEQFERHLEKDCADVIQVHGHRNEHKRPPLAEPHSYNLCGEPESGGELRVLRVTKES